MSRWQKVFLGFAVVGLTALAVFILFWIWIRGAIVKGMAGMAQQGILGASSQGSLAQVQTGAGSNLAVEILGGQTTLTATGKAEFPVAKVWVGNQVSKQANTAGNAAQSVINAIEKFF